MESWKTIEIGNSLRDEYLRLWKLYRDKMKEWQARYDLPDPTTSLFRIPIEETNLNGIENIREVPVPLGPHELAVKIRLYHHLGPQLANIRREVKEIKKFVKVPIRDKPKPRRKETTRLRIRVVHALAQGTHPRDLKSLYPKVTDKSLESKVYTDFNEAMKLFQEYRPLPPALATFFS